MNKLIINAQTGEVTQTTLTAEEIAEREAYERDVLPDLLWQQLRVERDRRLTETDWWVLPDRTATTEQLAYRQALRDLPANTTDPANPVWPEKPE